MSFEEQIDNKIKYYKDKILEKTRILHLKMYELERIRSLSYIKGIKLDVRGDRFYLNSNEIADKVNYYSIDSWGIGKYDTGSLYLDLSYKLNFNGSDYIIAFTSIDVGSWSDFDDCYSYSYRCVESIKNELINLGINKKLILKIINEIEEMDRCDYE